MRVGAHDTASPIESSSSSHKNLGRISNVPYQFSAGSPETSQLHSLTRIASEKAWLQQLPQKLSTRQNSFGLLQLRVLGFGLFQDRDLGVGVFPEGEEAFV